MEKHVSTLSSIAKIIEIFCIESRNTYTVMRTNLLRVNNNRKETGWKANNILYFYSKRKTVQLQTLLWFSSEEKT